MRSQLSQPHLNELLNACVRLCVCARAPMCVCVLVLACARSQMLFLPSALADAQRGANTPAAPGCALQAHLAELERLGAALGVALGDGVGDACGNELGMAVGNNVLGDALGNTLGDELGNALGDAGF